MHPSFARIIVWLVLAYGMSGVNLATALAAGATDEVDYNRDIRPILANSCFQCHGPDEKDRQAGLRLDAAEGFARPADSGQLAIVPGHPEQSELVRRILADDPAERMPPADSNKSLSDTQKTLLQRWIAAGAATPTHWSLVPPRRPGLPAVANGNWARNPIDLFVLSRLEREGLKPSPEAERLTLVRRVSLDLVGLPPTPAEADAFASDERPEAYDELVDRLLASPAYGERWARRWLDLARYADTNGYEKDRPRSVWPYRDWVIRALNDDMPFDRFTVRQLAGDLLPGCQLEDKIATGFHRNTMVNEEGGIDVEEFRYYAVVDRVNTTGAVWLGLTIGCAQCHTHKFDPITQHDYYQLYAFLNNADEPELAVPQPDVAEKRATITRQLAELESQRQPRLDEAKLTDWAAQAAKTARAWTVVAPVSVASSGHATMSVLPDGSVLVSGDKPNQDTYTVELAGDFSGVTAVRLEVLPHESLPSGGPGRAPLYSEGDFMLGEFSVASVLVKTAESPNADPVPLALRDVTHSFAADKMPASATIDNDLDTGWSIKGRAGQAHHAVFPLATPVDIDAAHHLRITLDHRFIHQMTIGRFRLSLTSTQRPKTSGLPGEVEAALLVAPAERSQQAQRVIKDHYLAVAPEMAELNKKLAELRKSLPPQPTTLVVEERPATQRRTTQLRHRGEFLSPRDTVEPGVPGVLPALSTAGHMDRLALARWLIDPGNPLTARVLVNRHWQNFFGRGLVRTTDDFGVRGEPPTHPELLDYLAVELVEHGWSIKQMHRRFVTSATYRQSSRHEAAPSEHDPENILLAHGPRFRVEAETVRDMALSAAGLLTRAIGGASVYPPQPAGVTDLAWGGAAWPTSQGADRFRRGLYTYLKRTSPYAAFVTFDGPSGENCAVRRERSNTPLQALTLLNDTVFIESAQALARRAVQSGAGSVEERARAMFRCCLTREPSAEELSDLGTFFSLQRERAAQHLDDAKKIAGDGEASQVAELAAWTLLARTILNLDEFVTKE